MHKALVTKYLLAEEFKLDQEPEDETDINAQTDTELPSDSSIAEENEQDEQSNINDWPRLCEV